MVGGKLDFQKNFPPMGESLGGKFFPPWEKVWGGSFSFFPPMVGGKWDWGSPPQAEIFANLLARRRRRFFLGKTFPPWENVWGGSFLRSPHGRMSGGEVEKNFPPPRPWGELTTPA